MRQLLRETVCRAMLLLALLMAGSGVAGAQSQSEEWNIGAYPVFVWIPTGIDIELRVPPGEGGDVGSIVESRFDGAYLAGFYASKGWFRADLDFAWAAIGGDRVDTPAFSVDADLVYFHGTGGVQVAPGFYATAGLRRLALKYDITVTGFPAFEREPGFWDPVVGVGYHLEGEGRPIEVHATFEVGGFGAGADVEYGAMGRVDWKPFPHFGVTGGYSFLYFKATDTVLDREFEVKQSVHGPVFGIGIYF